jgi:hypothetical protein
MCGLYLVLAAQVRSSCQPVLQSGLVTTRMHVDVDHDTWRWANGPAEPLLPHLERGRLRWSLKTRISASNYSVVQYNGAVFSAFEWASCLVAVKSRASRIVN